MAEASERDEREWRARPRRGPEALECGGIAGPARGESLPGEREREMK